MDNIRRALANAGLVRSSNNRLIGGVGGGLAQRFGVGPNVMRVIFFITLVVIPGSPILYYPVLWFLMPLDTQAGPALRSHDPSR